MKRIYLSGPMSGIKDFNAPMFRKVTAELREKGHTVVSPVEQDEAAGIQLDGRTGVEHEGATWGDCLARDVKIIADSGIDTIVVLPGWEKSKGARLEVFLGLLLNLDVQYYCPSELYWLPTETAFDIFAQQEKIGRGK